jgi:hypothetical protein
MKRPTPAAARDFVLFLAGLVLLAYETVAVPEPRWLLITIAAAMMGLPGALVADRLFLGRAPHPSPEAPAEPTPPAAPTESGPAT